MVGKRMQVFIFVQRDAKKQTNEENDCRLGNNCHMAAVMWQFVSKMYKKSTVLLSCECDWLLLWKTHENNWAIKNIWTLFALCFQNRQCYYKHYNYVHAIQENGQNPGK